MQISKKISILLINTLLMSCTACTANQRSTTDSDQTLNNTTDSNRNHSDSDQSAPSKAEKDSTNSNNINSVGNSAGNLNNYGYVAVQGDWVYYSSHNQIKKIKLDEDRQETVYSGSMDRIKFINVVGDWIYFQADTSSSTAVNPINGLYNTRADGTDSPKSGTIGNDGSGQYLTVIEDTLYYGNGTYSNSPLVKKSIADLVPHQLTSDGAANINIVDDWIYFVNTDKGSIEKIKRDGSEQTTLAQHGCIDIIVSNDWIYYKDKSDTISKIKTDGTENQKCADYIADRFNLDGDWIYYTIDNNPNGSHFELGADKEQFGIYKMKADGTDNQQIYSGEGVSNIFVIQEWLYFITNDGLSKIKSDGSELTIIED